MDTTKFLEELGKGKVTEETTKQLESIQVKTPLFTADKIAYKRDTGDYFSDLFKSAYTGAKTIPVSLTQILDPQSLNKRETSEWIKNTGESGLAGQSQLAQNLAGYNAFQEEQSTERINQLMSQGMTQGQASFESAKAGARDSIFDSASGIGSVIPSLASYFVNPLAAATSTFGSEFSESTTDVYNTVFEKDAEGNYTNTDEAIQSSKYGQEFVEKFGHNNTEPMREYVAENASKDATYNITNALLSGVQVAADRFVTAPIAKGISRFKVPGIQTGTGAALEGGVEAYAEGQRSANVFDATQDITGEGFASQFGITEAALSGAAGTGAIQGARTTGDVALGTTKAISNIIKGKPKDTSTTNATETNVIAANEILADIETAEASPVTESTTSTPPAETVVPANPIKDALQFDNTQLQAEGIPPVLASTLGSATNTIEAIASLSDYLSKKDNTQSNDDRMLVAQTLVDFIQQVNVTMNENQDSIGVDEKVDADLTKYGELVNSMQQDPRTIAALEAAMQMAQGIVVPDVTADNVDSPEGQKNVQQTITQAELAPESANIKNLDFILDQIEEGNIELPKTKVDSLKSARDLINAATEHARNLGEDLSESDRVSMEIRSLDNTTESGTKGKSAKDLFVEVTNAMKLGKTEQAAYSLKRLGDLAQSLHNKVEALNTSKAAPERNTRVKYDTISSHDGSPYQNQAYFSFSKKGQALASDVAADAKFLTDIYSSLVSTYGDMGTENVIPAIPTFETSIQNTAVAGQEAETSQSLADTPKGNEVTVADTSIPVPPVVSTPTSKIRIPAELQRSASHFIDKTNAFGSIETLPSTNQTATHNKVADNWLKEIDKYRTHLNKRIESGKLKATVAKPFLEYMASTEAALKEKGYSVVEPSTTTLEAPLKEESTSESKPAKAKSRISETTASRMSSERLNDELNVLMDIKNRTPIEKATFEVLDSEMIKREDAAAETLEQESIDEAAYISERESKAAETTSTEPKTKVSDEVSSEVSIFDQEKDTMFSGLLAQIKPFVSDAYYQDYIKRIGQISEKTKKTTVRNIVRELEDLVEQHKTYQGDLELEPEVAITNVTEAYPGLEEFTSRGEVSQPRFYSLYKLSAKVSKLPFVESPFTFIRSFMPSNDTKAAFNTIFGSKGTVESLKNAMQKQLDDYFKTSKSAKTTSPYVNGGQALNIANQNTDGSWTYNDKLLEGAILSSISWLQSRSRTSSVRDISDVAGFFGIEDGDVTPALFELARNSINTEQLVQGMSNEILRFWGVRGDKDVGTGATEGTVIALSKHIANAMLVGNDNVLGQVSNGNKGDHLFYPTPTSRGVNVFQVNPEFTVTLDALQNPELLQDLALNQKEVMYVFGDNKVPTRTTILRHDQTDITPEQRKAQSKAQKTKNYLNSRVVGFYGAVTDTGLDILFGSGYKDIPENFNANHKISLEGKRQQVNGAINELRFLMGKMKEEVGKNGEISKLAVKFPFVYTVVNRLQTVGRYNPQASTLMRAALLPTMGTYDISDVTGKEHGNFIRGIGQALGVKIENFEANELHAELDKKVTGDGQFVPVVEFLNQWTNSGEATLDAEALKKLFDDIGEVPSELAIQAILDLNAYRNADEASRKTFETGTYVEADGVTNGPTMANLMFGAELTERFVKFLNRGGIFIGSRNTLAQYRKKDSVDNYMSGSMLASQFTKDAVSKIEDEVKTNVEGATKHLEIAQGVFNLFSTFMGDITVEGDNVVISRNGFKNPMTVSLYGSGITGISNKLVGIFLESYYEKSSEVVQHMENGLSNEQAWSTVLYGDASGANLERYNLINFDLTALMGGFSSAKYNDDGDFIDYRVTSIPNSTSVYLPANAKDLSAFTVDPDHIQHMVRNVSTHLTTNMVNAVAEEMGVTYETSKAIQTVSNVQSLMITAAFVKKFESLMDSMPKGSIRADGLSQNQLNDIYTYLSTMMPSMDVDGVVHTLMKRRRISSSKGKYGNSIFGNMETDNSLQAPAPLGVGGAPNFIIGSGDGNNIVKFLNDPKTTERLLAIFDGVNLPIDLVQEQSELVNKATVSLLDNNPLKTIADNFNEFYKTFIQNVNIDQIVSENIELFSESLLPKHLRDNPEFTSEANLVEIIKSVADDVNFLNLRADEAVKVHTAMKEMGITSDQYSGSGNPFSSLDGLTTELTDASDVVQQLRSIVDKNKEGEITIPNVLEGIGKQDSTGAAVLNKDSVKNLIKLARDRSLLDEPTKEIIKLVGKNLTEDVRVMFGTKAQLKARMEVDGVNVTDSTADRLTLDWRGSGWFNLDTNTVYVLSDPVKAKREGRKVTEDELIRTVLHELLHSVTINKITTYFTDPSKLSSVDRASVKDIEELIPSIQKYSSMDLEDGSGNAILDHFVNNYVRDYDSKTDTAKAVTIAELVTWGLTNKNLEIFLKAIKQKGLPESNFKKGFIRLLNKLRVAVAKLLGIRDLNAHGRLTFATGVLLSGREITSLQNVQQELLKGIILDDDSTVSRVSDRLMSIAKSVDKQLPKKEQAARLANRAMNVQDMGTVVSTVVSRGFNLTPEQRTTMAMSIAAFDTDQKLNSNSIQRMSEYFDHALQNLTSDSFLVGIDNPTQGDIDTSKHQFEVITGEHIDQKDSKGRSLLLPTFVSLALVSDQFKEVLNSLPEMKSTKGEEGSFDGKMTSLGIKIIDTLAKQAAGEGNTGNVKTELENLYFSMIDTVEGQDSLVDSGFQSGARLLDKGNDYVSDAVTKTASTLETVGKRVQTSGNMAVDGLGKFSEFMGVALNAREGNVVGESFISLANTMGVPDYIKKPLTDIIGRTSTNKDVYDLVKEVRGTIHKERQRYRKETPTVLGRKFKNEMTEDNWTSLYNGIGKADLASLMVGTNKLNASEVFTLVQNNKALNSEITQRETGLDKYTLDKAKQLAEFMNTGNSGSYLLRNANSIAASKQSKLSMGDAKAIENLDKLITLYALKGSTSLNELQRLAKTEAEGVEFLLNYMDGTRKGEFEKAKFYKQGNGQMNAYKGYIPTESTAQGDVIVANDSEQDRLERKGYTRLRDYESSKHDPDKAKKGYYISEVSTRAGFNQGIVQNAQKSYFGVDTLMGITIQGHTSGIISDGLEVNKINRLVDRGIDIGNLMPIMAFNGKVVAYERTMDPSVTALLKEDTNIARMAGVWKGRQVEEIQAQAANEILVDNLKQMYETAGDRKHEFVDILDPKYLKNNPLVKDAISIISSDTIRYINQTMDGKFMVRSDMVQDVVGYRGMSIGELWTLDTDNRFKKGIKDSLELLLGKDAYKILIKGETLLENLVAEAKTNIVVRSMIVPAINIVSNMYVMFGMGVPISTMSKGIRDKTVETEKYVEGAIREVEIEAEIQAASTNLSRKRKLQAELTNLRDSYKRLSIWPLIEKGEFASVVDPSISREELLLPQGRLSEYVGNQIDKLPAGLHGIAKNVLITKDTALFKALQKSVDYGDFVAKAIVYDHLMNVDGKTSDEALGVITEIFINYDVLPGRVRGKLERLGLLWFWNYKVRSVKLAIYMMREKPLTALIGGSLPDIPGIGSAGTPINDNIIYKAVQGELGLSMGFGQGLRSPQLHPINWIAD